MLHAKSLFFMALATFGCLAAAHAVAADQDFAGREHLRAHSAEFRKEVIEVADGVLVAVGYSASNVTLIRGKTGSIVVDTSANPTDARAIVAAFGSRLVRPLRAIIYTHNHPDHSGGAPVFAGNDRPDIISHQSLLDARPEIARGLRDGGDAFGTALPAQQFINAGIQLEYGRVTPHTREGFLRPNLTFGGNEQTLTIDGVEIRLVHTPGESPENVAVWLPAKRVLMPGDDFYLSFPNLAPIRGLPLRPVEQWIASLDKMIALHADHLVPGHMRPIQGKEQVASALTAYRDGIKTVFDQTIAGIRQGLTPDELVQQVELPPALASNPCLQEYYGGVAWTVRGIYAAYVGWFDGNPTHLFPLPPKERVERIVAMAGGADRVLARAKDALSAGDFQWAAELADYLLAIAPAHAEASAVKARALRELGERQMNATARNYYLSAAQALDNSQ